VLLCLSAFFNSWSDNSKVPIVCWFSL